MKDLTLGFIGLGLIGGSIAKSVKRVNPDVHIIAYNRTKSRLDLAVSDGVVNEVADDVDETFAKCDYIFLCTPVEQNNTYLNILKNIIKEDAIITDVGSVKTPIHEAIEKVGLERNFIGGHPMAGSEKTGYENSNNHLFENAYYVISTSPLSPMDKVEEYKAFAAEIGAIPIVLDHNEHDMVVAAISHMPHLIASSLVNVVKNSDNEEGTMKTIAAGGFKDITRIASSSPEMWEQICTSNSKSISIMLDKFIKDMQKAQEYVDTKNGQAINEMFASSREYRDSFPDKGGAIFKPSMIYCDVEDEAGVIARIATLLAKNDISIKNIGIIHNRMFEEGVLLLELYDDSDRDHAVSVLQTGGITVIKRK